jgi:hypothetical protein
LEWKGVGKKKIVESFVLIWFCSAGFGFGDFSGFVSLETNKLFF